MQHRAVVQVHQRVFLDPSVGWLDKTLPLPLPTENEVEISRIPFDIDIQEQNGQTNLRRVTEDSSIRQMIKHC
jgi:hypothetical protein